MTLLLENIYKSFPIQSGILPVLDGVSLALPPGELLCLLGPSGSGKTTLLKLIAGLDRPSSGKITLKGQIISRPGRERCLVFQDCALFPWYTVEQNIEFGLIIKDIDVKQRRERVQELLENIGLQEFRRYYPKEISGGMQQRVAVARALAVSPEILLMDEPFGALDAQTRNSLQGFLVDIWLKTSVTIIFVTHSVDEAIYLASELTCLTKRPGKIGLSVKIDLPRPRDRTHRDFVRIRREILHYLHDQAVRDAG